MKKFTFKKLIRDNILDSMLAEGCNVEYRKLGGNDHRKVLVAKLIEEAAEVESALGTEEFLEELADAQLVIDALVSGLGTEEAKEFEATHNQKLNKKGGFSEGVWVDTVEVPDDSPWVEYFNKKPDKYPEIK